jgi:hypothetical protein
LNFLVKHLSLLCFFFLHFSQRIDLHITKYIKKAIENIALGITQDTQLVVDIFSNLEAKSFLFLMEIVLSFFDPWSECAEIGSKWDFLPYFAPKSFPLPWIMVSTSFGQVPSRSLV